MGNVGTNRWAFGGRNKRNTKKVCRGKRGHIGGRIVGCIGAAYKRTKRGK